MDVSAIPLVANEVLELYHVKATVKAGSKWKFSSLFPVSVLFHIKGAPGFLYDVKLKQRSIFIDRKKCGWSASNTIKNYLTWEADGNVEFLEARITSAYFQSLLSDVYTGEGSFLARLSRKPLSQNKEIMEIIHRINPTIVKNENLKKIYYQARAMELLAVFFEHMLNPVPSPSILPRNIKLAQSVKQEVDRLKGKKTFTIINLAKKLGSNETTIKKSFKNVYGKTIFSYYIERNMQKARKALQAGVSVTQASSDCGYSNIAHFSTAFKREFGINPSTISEKR